MSIQMEEILSQLGQMATLPMEITTLAHTSKSSQII